jgi:hypothetical protein
MLPRLLSLRAIPRLLPALVPVLVASAFVACSGLKRADDPEDGGSDGGGDEAPILGEDASTRDGSVDAATVDAGDPPLDFECTTDPWTKATKGKKECEPRQVKVVEVMAPLDARGISIARTPAGRVGIVYNAELDADTGEMHFAYFTPATPTYAAPKVIKRSTGQGFHDGFDAKLAASAPDTLALLTYDCDTTSGEVHLRKLVAGKEPLTDALVATGVKRPTEIALASDPAGNTVATYRFATSTPLAKLSSKLGTPAGAFTALPDLATALHPGDAPGIGGASMFVDPGGQVHLVHHYNDGVTAPQFSMPRYHTLAGTAWSDKKTIDNNAPDGLSGYSASVAVFGTKKYAAVFFRKAGQGSTPTADLRLVSWDGVLDTVTTEILDQQIPSADALYPSYRVVIAVDKFGLLHVAILRPTSLKNGYLEYRRQTRTPGGGTKWLSDIVDPDVMSELSSAFVDMVVDEHARPHIAYRSAKDGLVRYATRFDR